MTTQDYITTYAPKFAAQTTRHDANALCKEIQTLCNCDTQTAVKTLIAAFDEALKLRGGAACQTIQTAPTC